MKEGWINGNGYVWVYLPGHRLALENGATPRSWSVVEEAAPGVFNPEKGHQVHHVNRIITDDRNENLVVCESRAYHALLHKRTRAYQECGHANWLSCNHCKKWDNPENMYVSSTRRAMHYHRECYNQWHQVNREKNKNVSE